MSLEVTLDDNEMAELRGQIQRTLSECAGLPTTAALVAASACLQVFIDQFAGARVYVQSSRSRTAPEIVEQIETELRRGGKSTRDIGKEVGVSHVTVIRIRRRMAEAPTLLPVDSRTANDSAQAESMPAANRGLSPIGQDGG